MRDAPRSYEPEVGPVPAGVRPLGPARVRGHLLRRFLRSAAYLAPTIAALAVGGVFAGTRGLVVAGARGPGRRLGAGGAAPDRADRPIAPGRRMGESLSAISKMASPVAGTRRRGLLGGPGQVDMERGPLPGPALYGEAPVV